MPSRFLALCAPLIFTAFAPLASAESPHPNPPGLLARGQVPVEIEYVNTAFGGGDTWTVFADGRVQHVRFAGGPEGGDGFLRSGTLSRASFKALRKRVAQSGLVGARFSQQPDPMLCVEGVTRLTLAGKQLSPPAVGTPTVETQRLSAKLEAFAAELRTACEPHLTERHPAGVYAKARVSSAEETKQTLASGVLQIPTLKPDKAMHPALRYPGAFVRVTDVQATPNGRPVLVEGHLVVWSVHKLGASE